MELVYSTTCTCSCVNFMHYIFIVEFKWWNTSIYCTRTVFIHSCLQWKVPMGRYQLSAIWDIFHSLFSKEEIHQKCTTILLDSFDNQRKIMYDRSSATSTIVQNSFDVNPLSSTENLNALARFEAICHTIMSLGPNISAVDSFYTENRIVPYTFSVRTFIEDSILWWKL